MTNIDYLHQAITELQDEVSQLKHELAEAKRIIASLMPGDAGHVAQGDGWISVEDRLPEPNVVVIVAFGDGEVAPAQWLRSVWSYWRMDADITHWMPMPPAPGGNSDE